MNVTIIAISKNIQNEKIIDVKFHCNDCGNEYIITDDDEKRSDEFIESLVKNYPNKYIGCPKCDLKSKSKLC